MSPIWNSFTFSLVLLELIFVATKADRQLIPYHNVTVVSYDDLLATRTFDCGDRYRMHVRKAIIEVAGTGVTCFATDVFLRICEQLHQCTLKKSQFQDVYSRCPQLDWSDDSVTLYFHHECKTEQQLPQIGE